MGLRTPASSATALSWCDRRFGIRQSVIPAVDADGPAVHKAPRHSSARLGDKPRKCWPGDAHPLGGLFVVQSQGIRQSDGFKTVQRQCDAAQLSQGIPWGL